MTSGDDLIATFLGHPDQPTPLGQEILSLTVGEVAKKIDQLLRSSQTHIAALEELMHQTGFSQAQFAASHEMLLGRIRDWKNEADIRQRNTLNSFLHGSSAEQSFDWKALQLQSTPPRSVLDCEPKTCTRFYSEKNLRYSASKTSETFHDVGPILPPFINCSTQSRFFSQQNTELRKCDNRNMDLFLNSVVLNETPGNQKKNMENTCQQKNKISEVSGTCHSGKTPCIQRFTPISPSLSPAGYTSRNERNAVTVPPDSGSNVQSPFPATPHRIPSCPDAIQPSSQKYLGVAVVNTPLTSKSLYSQTRDSIDRPVPLSMPYQQCSRNKLVEANPVSFYYKPTELSPKVSASNCISFQSQTITEDIPLKIPVTSYDSSSPLLYEGLPPAPHSSPIMCSSDYFDKDQVDYQTAMDMLHAVSRQLADTAKPEELNWESNEFKSSLKSLLVSLGNISFEKAESKMGLQDELVPFNGKHTESLLEEFDHPSLSIDPVKQKNEPSDYENSTQASSRRESLRTSVSSSGRTSVSSSLWTCIDDTKQSFRHNFKSFNEAESFLKEHLSLFDEGPDRSKVHVCCKLLGLEMENITTHEVERATDHLISSLTYLAWEQAWEEAAAQYWPLARSSTPLPPSSKENEALHGNIGTFSKKNISQSNHLKRLPELVAQIKSTANVCLHRIQEALIQRLHQKNVQEDDAIAAFEQQNPMTLLNFPFPIPVRYHQNIFQNNESHGNRVSYSESFPSNAFAGPSWCFGRGQVLRSVVSTDLELLRNWGRLGTPKYESALRQKLFDAMVNCFQSEDMFET